MKKAFSLIELLIVIMIIGIVYTLSVSNFTRMKDTQKRLTLKGLKEYLQKIPHEKSVKLLCLEKCATCSVVADGKKLQDIEGFLDKSVESFRYDSSYGMLEIERERGICFSYEINKKGVGQQVFVKFDNKVYDFSSYLGVTPIYGSIEEAGDVQEQRVREILE